MTAEACKQNQPGRDGRRCRARSASSSAAGSFCALPSPQVVQRAARRVAEAVECRILIDLLEHRDEWPEDGGTTGYRPPPPSRTQSWAGVLGLASTCY
jgi:hypothetical protein